MRTVVWLAWVFLAVLARGQPDFRATVAFGDSLTDNDAEVINPTNAWVYGKDPVELLFDKVPGQSKSLATYAKGASITGHLQSQFAAYAAAVSAGRQDLATFASFEIGANDVALNMLRLTASPPGRTRRTDDYVDGLTTLLRDQLLMAITSHPKAHYVVWLIPDITVAPGFPAIFSENARRNLRGHTRRVNDALRRLGERPNVAIFDLDVVWASVKDRPPTLKGLTLVGPPAHGQPHHLFADIAHPTAVTNGLIANALIDCVNSKWKTSIPRYGEDELHALATLRAPAPPAGPGLTPAPRRTPDAAPPPVGR